jgi:hypothetical protein
MSDAVKELDAFEAYLVDVARQLREIGVATRTFRNDPGEEHEGWQFSYRDFRLRREPNRGAPGLGRTAVFSPAGSRDLEGQEVKEGALYDGRSRDLQRAGQTGGL